MANLLNTLKNLFSSKNNDDNIRLYSKLKNQKKSLKLKINKRTYRIELLMKNWRTAVQMAEDPIRPRRAMLYRLYHIAMEDDRLLTQVRTARFTIQLAGFVIEHNGDEDESLHDLFEVPWFYEYLQYAVDSELYGHSLIEFSKSNPDSLFDHIELIPREHVRPESGEVVINEFDEEGLPFRSGPLTRFLMEIGKSDDLGLLKPLSKLVIRKDYNITDWGRRNERFGMPFTIVNTATRDEKELDKKQEMLENFGSNMWAIMDDQDEVNIMEPKSATNGHLSFKDFCAYIDDGIALLVNGQTSTSDEKAYVGSAEVHERILNKYTKARMRRIQNHINFDLIPFLIRHGYPLTDAQFKFIDLMEEDDENTTETPIKKEENNSKKKS